MWASGKCPAIVMQLRASSGSASSRLGDLGQIDFDLFISSSFLISNMGTMMV